MNVRGETPILVTRGGVPYEENGFQVRSGVDVGRVELREMNDSLIDELRTLERELRRIDASVVDVHAGLRPLKASEMRLDKLDTEKIASYFVEKHGHPLLSREENLTLLKKNGVKPTEASLRAILASGAKIQEVGEEHTREVSVIRWPLSAELEDGFAVYGRNIDGVVMERLRMCESNRVLDDIGFGTVLYILGRCQ